MHPSIQNLCLVTLLSWGGLALAAWTPVQLHNGMDRALHLFTDGAEGPLVVVRTSALDGVQPGALGWGGVEAPLDPHAEAHRYDLVVNPSS
jgi:hypothetical protein